MQTVAIDTDRLAKITTLKASSHSPNDGRNVCIMEAVAYVAGEPWSDHPECACPVIGAFLRNWNDNLPDEDRTRLLLPLVPKLVGTRGSQALMNRRAYMATDWMVREYTPAWLRLAGLTAQADLLASLPEITKLSIPAIKAPLEAVKADAAAAWDAAWDAARAAAWDAAWDAARAAAWDAARAAAWDAAWDAARAAAWDAAWDAARAAAWDAARAAARDAARAAARAAARDAARAALKSTTTSLQASAVALVERMCALTDADLAEAA